VPGKLSAVLLGIGISVVHFSVFIAVAYAALKTRVTTAAAIMYAGILLRLGIVGAVMLALVESKYWEPRIYWVTGGLIASQTVFMIIEIALIIRMETFLNEATKGAS
jgi:hypothetical protein